MTIDEFGDDRALQGGLPDAVIPDPQASYAAARDTPLLTGADLDLVEQQLGRPSRGESAAVHTCGHGLATVVRVAPRLEDGTPFPTTFWLTCPLMNQAVGTLEANKAMVEVNTWIATDETFARDYRHAQQRLIEFRDELGGGDKLPGDPTAGGQPGHVKCLHTHVAHHLATGDNVVGQWAVEQIRPMACPGPCAGAPAS